MKILALIAARSGSKRLPNKNKLLLGGRPLISWTIDVAKEVDEFCEIIVSTDDKDILTIAKNSGVLAPWIRPSNLSDDTASLVDVALHAISWFEINLYEIDAVMLLQPTSPFRSKNIIDKALALFKDNPKVPVISVTSIDKSFHWAMKMQENGFISPVESLKEINTRSQDLEKTYILNGVIYLISVEELKKNRSFVLEENTPLIIGSGREVLDIDTKSDFDLAKFFLKEMND
jgi:CMP-N-acetylneuraminic acid synthetase